jgi:predicted Zn-dependent protease
MLRNLILITVCGWLWFCAGCEVNPITGEERLMLFPEEQDVELGRKYAPEVEKALGGRVEDQALQNYVDSVGQKIARISHRPDFKYHYVAVKDKSTNAVALPGGYVFITKGMLTKLKSEAELAGVLAHETAHITARDVSNAMSNQIGIEILLTAVASRTSSQAVMTAADLAGQIVGLRFSRDDERTADLGGMDYMVRAGYSPYGMVETMEMLEQEQTIRPIEFLSSHPPPENRVAYLRQRIQTHYFNSAAGLLVGKEDYSSNVLERLKN